MIGLTLAKNDIIEITNENESEGKGLKYWVLFSCGGCGKPALFNHRESKREIMVRQSSDIAFFCCKKCLKSVSIKGVGE